MAKIEVNMAEAVIANCSDDEKVMIALIVTEYRNACEKHPKWPVDYIHAAAIVQEEAGELIQAALQHRYENKQFSRMRSEACQVGAMGLRFLLRTQGYWCAMCGHFVTDEEVTSDHRHDPDKGGCGCSVE